MIERADILDLCRSGAILVRTPDFDIRAGLAKNGNDESVLKAIDSLGPRSKIRQIEINGDTLFISEEGLVLFTLEVPYKTGNESDAVYLARHQSEGLEILLQYMPPNSRTSHHWHDGEIYIPVAGDFYVWRNQKEVVRIGRRVEINPGETHIGFTFNHPSITLIIAIGDIYHNHLKRPPLDFLHEQAKLQGFSPY